MIDPHIHLFDLVRGEYAWLRPENPPHWPDKPVICRDFTEHDLLGNLPAELTGFVHVEAGFDNAQPWREIAWLEQTVTRPFKSIATVDLTWSSAQFDHCLTRLSAYQSVVGVRHILDEDTQRLLGSKQVQRNFQQLANSGLIFELQYPVQDTSATNLICALATQQADLRLVLNHAGFPPVNCMGDEPWRMWQVNLTRLAQHPQVWVKVSGLEMTDRQYTAAQYANALSTCLERFGSARVMLASNFPLCLFRGDYHACWQQAFSSSNSSDTMALTHRNAARCYGF